jgi:hypothetical protein
MSGERESKSFSGQWKYTLIGCSPDVIMSLGVKSDPVKHRTDSFVSIRFIRRVNVPQQSRKNLLLKSAWAKSTSKKRVARSG